MVSKNLKSALEKEAKKNTVVTVKNQRLKSEKSVKSGVALDNSQKTRMNKKNTNRDCTEDAVVGVSLGVTRNMDNFESLRVDCWLTDKVHDGESAEQAYARVLKVVDSVLEDTLNSYL